MTIDILTELIPIPCTDRETIDKLRSLLIEIQAAWLDSLFDSGLTFSTPEIWEKMQEAVCLMQRRDDPSKKGIDLKAIASDYKLLEQIFIAKHWETNGYVLDDSSFVGCDLIQAHHFSALGTLRKVDALHQSILLAKKKELSLKDLKQKLVDAIADDDLSEVGRLILENDEQQKIWEEAERLQKKLLQVRQALQGSDILRAKEIVGLWQDPNRTIEQRVVDSYSFEVVPVAGIDIEV